MLYASGVLSLIVQVIVGIIDYLAIQLNIESKDEILKDLLKVEFGVQIVEFIFYVWLLITANTNITPYRYIDWSITTPLMLITLSAFLNHDGSKPGRLTDFISENKDSILKIVMLNAAMLFCGLMGELGYLSVYTAVGLGFIPFVLNFKHIHDTFLTEDKYKRALFYWFVFFWSLYGVLATMNYTVKNVGYNILDVFAKNFFGVFLAYFILQKSDKTTEPSLTKKNE
jgi:bacteriorhodopsin